MFPKQRHKFRKAAAILHCCQRQSLQQSFGSPDTMQGAVFSIHAGQNRVGPPNFSKRGLRCSLHEGASCIVAAACKGMRAESCGFP